MTAIIRDSSLEEKLRADRAASGADRYDEVWEGVHMMSPLAENEHQRIVGRLYSAVQSTVGAAGNGEVYPGANVTDRDEHRTENYGCPDVAVFLNDNPAIDCGTHWSGGPDPAVEIISHNDRALKKREFYAAVNTRELLIIDRDPWQLEMYELIEGPLVLRTTVTPNDSNTIQSKVVDAEFAFAPGDTRPTIIVRQMTGDGAWTI